MCLNNNKRISLRETEREKIREGECVSSMRRCLGTYASLRVKIFHIYLTQNSRLSVSERMSSCSITVKKTFSARNNNNNV